MSDKRGHQRKSHHQRQRGAALIIVLVMVAAVSVIALGITQTMTRSQQRTGASQDRDQAVWLLLGAEEAALHLLRVQDEVRSNVDTAEEAWLSQPVTFPLPNALLTASFADRSACFNINGLVTKSDETGLTANAEAIRAFGQLVTQLGADPRAGETLASTAADFIDVNNSPEPGGAEDFTYARREVPYKTAGTLLQSVTELRAVEGWSQSIYTALAPYLCAQGGEPGPGLLNLNTLVAEDAPFLYAALGGVLSLRDMERIIEDRPPDGYADVQAFLGRQDFQSLSNPIGPEVSGRLATFASHIEFTSRVSYGEREFIMTTTIMNERGGKAKILRRQFGGVQ
ncbi:MAG: type II secretion system minor pseudopilin GspK [Pseudomonadota bacterium]